MRCRMYSCPSSKRLIRYIYIDYKYKFLISVIDLMDSFTLEQVSDFINVAIENKASNLLALLMDYKYQHFADFDPMDAFLLE